MHIKTIHGPILRDLVVRDRILLDNSHEHTLNLEYRLKRPLRMPDGRIVLPDEVIKRSAHVRLKEWPSGMEGLIAHAFLHRGTGGLTPTGARPGEVTARHLRHLSRGFRFANSAGMCLSFKMEILNGSHALGTQAANGTRTVTTKDTFKMALYLVTGSRSNADTVYNNTGELAGTGNYTQTGQDVTNATVPALDGSTAHWTPSASVSWADLTSSAAFDAALLYNNASTSKLAIAVFTFSEQNISAGTFTLTMPTNNGTTGLIRIA